MKDHAGETLPTSRRASRCAFSVHCPPSPQRFSSLKPRRLILALSMAGLSACIAPTLHAAQFYVNDGTDNACVRMRDGGAIGQPGDVRAVGNEPLCAINDLSQMGAAEAGTLVLNQNGGFLKGNLAIDGELNLNAHRVRGMLPGIAPNDGANVEQIIPLINGLGGGAKIDGTGKVSGPSYRLSDGKGGSVTFSNVGAALVQADSRIVKNQQAIDAQTRYFKADGARDGSDDAVAGKQAVAIGAGARAAAEGALAMGQGASAEGKAGVALGKRARALADSTAIGPEAAASAPATVAVGWQSEASGLTSVAVGALAKARGLSAIALGQQSEASAESSVALGWQSSAQAVGAIAVGTLSRATGVASLATGREAVASAEGSIATGWRATASQTHAIALGTKAEARGAYSLANGSSAQALGDRSVAMGANAAALAERSLALGAGAVVEAGAQDGVAIGRAAKVAGSAVNSVALGQGSVADRAQTISVGSATQQRQITYLAAGTADTDAVNLSQLKSSVALLGGGARIAADGSVVAPSYVVNDLASGRAVTHRTVGDALNASNRNMTQIDGRVTVNRSDIDQLQKKISDGSVGLVQQDAKTRDIQVAGNTDGGRVNFRGKTGDRRLAGVARGAVSANSSEAVNGAQLYETQGKLDLVGSQVATNQQAINTVSGQVAQNTQSIVQLDNRVGKNEGDIRQISQQLEDGVTGLVKFDAASGVTSVAAGKGGAIVDIRGTAGDRTLRGVSRGTVSAFSNEAVNGAQLHETQEQLQDVGNKVTTNQQAIGDLSGQVTQNTQTIVQLDDRVSKNEGDIHQISQQLEDGVAGLVKFDAVSGITSVAAGKGGTVVDIRGTAGDRTLSGVADGTVSATSNEAVNGAQLHETQEQLQDVGDQVATNQQSINALSGQVTQHTQTIVQLDDRVSKNEGDIHQISQQLEEGVAGLVKFDAASGVTSVAAGKGGTVVDIRGTAGDRRLSGVADGTVSATSNEAVNGAQLHETQEQLQDVGDQVATNQQSINALSGQVTQHTQTIVQLDDRVSKNEGDIDQISQQLEEGVAGLVKFDAASGVTSVAAGKGGTMVDIGGLDGPRVLTGVANGVNDHDAATVAQLKAAGVYDPVEDRILGALVYDDIDLAKATLGGVNGTLITNLAPGAIAKGSMDAINGGQLFDVQAGLQGQLDALRDVTYGMGDRLAEVEQKVEDHQGSGQGSGNGTGDNVDAPGSAPGSVQVGAGGKATGTGSTVVGSNAAASGDNSTAMGSGARAAGQGSTALGAGAVASADNAVALGSGSVADRDNTVSVGSAGKERQVTHVAAGTERTDAANWGQVQDAISDVKDWTDTRLRGLSRDIERARRQANRGIAASAAMVDNMPYLPGKLVLNAGMASYRGEAALGVGLSRWSESGRVNLNAGIAAARGDVPIFRIGVGVVLGD